MNICFKWYCSAETRTISILRVNPISLLNEMLGLAGKWSL